MEIPDRLFEIAASRLPELPQKLESADIKKTPVQFLRQCFGFGLMLGIAFFFILMGISSVFKMSLFIIILLSLGAVALGIFYSYKQPDFMVLNIEKGINKEIVYAARFLMIELESGVPIYNALKSCALNYEVVGKWLGKIVTRVDMGVPIETAMNEMILVTPSANLRRVLWQLLNSLKTGSDVAPALNSVIDQIIREQEIEVKEYGRKLNPIGMFYMIMAIIMPSVGIIILVILSTFIGIRLDLISLLSLAAFFGFMQFMFYNMIKSQRPAVEL